MKKHLNEYIDIPEEHPGYSEFISNIYDELVDRGFSDDEALLMSGEDSKMFTEVIGEYFNVSQHEPGIINELIPILIDMYNRQYAVTESKKIGAITVRDSL